MITLTDKELAYLLTSVYGKFRDVLYCSGGALEPCEHSYNHAVADKVIIGYRRTDYFKIQTAAVELKDSIQQLIDKLEGQK